MCGCDFLFLIPENRPLRPAQSARVIARNFWRMKKWHVPILTPHF